MTHRSGVYDAMSAGRFLKIKKEFFTAFFEALQSKSRVCNLGFVVSGSGFSVQILRFRARERV